MILNAYGKTVSPPMGEVSGKPGGYEMLSSYPSQGLTPERLAAIFKEADMGDITRQVELFEEMEEKDAHLGAVLQIRKLAASRLEWTVASASESAQDNEIAEFASDALSALGGFEESLTELMDAVGKGFSIAEIIWELNGKSVRVAELKNCPQKFFTFSSTDGPSDTPRLITKDERMHGVALPANKFVVHRYRSRSGITPRAGVLRPCAYAYLFKNYTLKDWIIFNERYAMPMRLGKYAAGSTDADRRVLRNAVFNLGSDAAAVISDSTMIELLESTGKAASADIYEKMADFCNKSMTKAVLGHAASAEGTPGRLGGEHEAKAIRQDLLEADAKSLGGSITSQLIAPLVRFNFGDDVRVPIFRLLSEDRENLRALAQTFKVLSDMGIGIPHQYVRERFGIPEQGGNG